MGIKGLDLETSVGICHYMLVPQVKEVSFLRLYLLLSLSPL